jgi:hypothetical protein
MIRSLARIRSTAALALAVAAVAAPAAIADTPVGQDQLSIDSTAVQHETAPAVKPVSSDDGVDWLEVGGLTGVLLLAGGTMAGVHVRRRAVPTA